MAEVILGGATVTYNGAIPSIGALAVQADVKIGVGAKTVVDMSHQYSLGTMSGVQTVYINLSEIPHNVTIEMYDTGQRITAFAGTQGYYPVLATNIMKFDITSNATEEFSVPIHFINFPIALGVWQAKPQSRDNGGGGGGDFKGLPYAGIVGGKMMMEGEKFIKLVAREEWGDNADGLVTYDPLDPDAPEWDNEVPVHFNKTGVTQVDLFLEFSADIPPEYLDVSFGRLRTDELGEERITGFRDTKKVFVEYVSEDGSYTSYAVKLSGIIHARAGNQLAIAIHSGSDTITYINYDIQLVQYKEI